MYQFHQSECSFGKWMHCDRKTITFQLQNIFFSSGWFPCWPISCFAACTIAVTGLWSQANWPLVIIFICHYLSGEFSKAIRKSTNFTLGLYHSLYEWFHPLYMKDVKMLQIILQHRIMWRLSIIEVIRRGPQWG